MAAAGNRTGILSSFTDLFNPDEPDMKGKLVVFDPAVFNRTKGQLKDYDANKTEWKDTYDKFKTDWESGQPAAEANANQEKSFLDKFYDGSFANHLAGLRAVEADARRAAGDRALQYAQGANDRAAILRGDATGNSSASRAMALRAGRDVENDIAMNGIARERGDLDYVTKEQQGNLGVRTNILDAVAKRQLFPHQLNDQELMYSINALRGIQATRLGAASPVFWREKSGSEKVGDVLDTFADSAYKGANAYSTFSGMGGGGMGGMGGGGSPGGGGSTSGAQSSAVAQEYYMGNPSNVSAPSTGGTFNYSAPNIPATGGYNPGSVNPYPPQRNSWYDNYSPGNDPNYWKNYNGTQTFG
jgi:hypothetical protein